MRQPKEAMRAVTNLESDGGVDARALRRRVSARVGDVLNGAYGGGGAVSAVADARLRGTDGDCEGGVRKAGITVDLIPDIAALLHRELTGAGPGVRDATVMTKARTYPAKPANEPHCVSLATKGLASTREPAAHSQHGARASQR